MTPQPPPIRVAVNDRQLPAVAVLERGRVLVPLRAIVEALHLNLGEIHLPLKKPARVIAGRWYAPVRDMANLVHAQIQYDAKAELVAVYVPGAETLAQATPIPSPQPVAVSGREPESDTRVGSPYPTIAADLDLPNGSTIRTLHLTLDGVDRSLDAIYQGTDVTYIPRAALNAGTHTVDISGTTSSGVPFDTSWSFETTQPPPAPGGNAIGGFPWTNGVSYLQLTVPGTQFVGGAPVPVQLIAPSGGAAFAFICTSSWQYQLFSAPSSQFYSGSVPTPPVNYPISCPITAFFVDPNGNVTYAPYPQVVQLLPATAPQVTPTPARIRVPLRVHTALPQPTLRPIPRPTLRPISKPTLRPIPRTTLRPIRLATPALHPAAKATPV